MPVDAGDQWVRRAQLAQADVLRPTMLSRVSESRSPVAATAGGQLSTVFCGMKVEVPLMAMSLPLTGDSRGELALPASVGLSDAAACPLK